MFFGNSQYASIELLSRYDGYVDRIRRSRAGVSPVVSIKEEITEFLNIESSFEISFTSIINMDEKILVGCSDSNILVFDEVDLQLLKKLSHHENGVKGLMVSHSERNFISFSNEKICSWGKSLGQLYSLQYERKHDNRITCLTKLKKGGLFCYGDKNGAVICVNEELIRVNGKGQNSNRTLLTTVSAITPSLTNENIVFVAGKKIGGGGGYYENDIVIQSFSFEDVNILTETISAEVHLNCQRKPIVALTSFLDCAGNEIIVSSSSSTCQRIAFWNATDKQLLKIVKKFGPRDFLISKRQKVFVSTSHDSITFWDLEKLRKVKEMRVFDGDAIRSLCWIGNKISNNHNDNSEMNVGRKSKREQICCGSRDGKLMILDNFLLHEGDSIDIDYKERKDYVVDEIQNDWMNFRVVNGINGILQFSKIFFLL